MGDTADKENSHVDSILGLSIALFCLGFIFILLVTAFFVYRFLVTKKKPWTGASEAVAMAMDELRVVNEDLDRRICELEKGLSDQVLVSTRRSPSPGSVGGEPVLQRENLAACETSGRPSSSSLKLVLPEKRHSSQPSPVQITTHMTTRLMAPLNTVPFFPCDRSLN